MVEPISFSVVVAKLAVSAPQWVPVLEKTVLNKGREYASGRVKRVIDDRERVHNLERALANAAEAGIAPFQTQTERDTYRRVLETLSSDQGGSLREEALRLLTLSDSPNFAALNDEYNRLERCHALGQDQPPISIDATPYLQSFFDALVGQLFIDPLFREQLSDAIRVRATLSTQRSLQETVTLLAQIYNLLGDNYSTTKFDEDLMKYLIHIETALRNHRLVGIPYDSAFDTAPQLEHIFVPLKVAVERHDSGARRDREIFEQTVENSELIDSFEEALWVSPTTSRTDESRAGTSVLAALEKSSYLVLLGGPGSGKSMTGRYIAWSHARGNLSDGPQQSTPLLEGKPVPLRIELRLLADERRKQSSLSILAYAAEIMLARAGVHVDGRMFDELLKRHLMFVVFYSGPRNLDSGSGLKT